MIKTLLFSAGLALYAGSSWALINGEKADYPEVVRLQADGAKVCTGTIIGPQTIVSAAHCATSDAPFFVYNGEKYPVRYIASGGQAQGHDIALAVTDKKIKGAIFARLGQGLRHGVKILMAGFGCTHKGGKPGALRSGENRVIGMDEDHVLAASRDGSVLCEGDSGGPAFVMDGVKRRLVGVSSLSDISKININVRLDSKLSRAFLAAAAKIYRLEICGITKDCF
jgi:secreted trypsin-like serine protease